VKILLRNAILYDGVSLFGKETDVAIHGGLIEAIGEADLRGGFDVIHDLSGKILCPGFIDLHCHLRDPGQEWREDLFSGSAAGAAGGFTTIVCMPNTDPPLDSPALVSYVLEKSERSPGSRILPAGCVSRGRKGKVLAEMGKMAKAGAVIFTDDGSPVSDTGLLRLALQYSSWLGVRLMEHPEEKSLTADAQVNEGICSTLTGLKGWPSSAEASDISRGVSLCRDTGVPIHFTHVSAEDSLRVLREAKASKLPVTFDVTPHHLCLSEENVIEGGYDSVFKVNPPLRSRRDRDALWEAVAEGIVDAIATDHAPWHLDEKDLPFQEASFGIASLECAVAVVLTEWEDRGRPCSLERLLGLFTSGPASILQGEWGGAGAGRIEVGLTADLTVLDPELERIVNVEEWKSKARLTPWNGRRLRGWPVMTMVGGRTVHPVEDIDRGLS